ncbi:MAG: FAD-dependent oxidoreductase, partial [Planctomycetota bacterium]
MPEWQTDVLVVGAGAVGLNTAYYLRKAGADVTIVDRGGFGSGCSFGNAGLLAPSHLVPLAAPGVILQGLKWMLNPASPFYIKPRFDRQLLAWLWAFRRYCTEAHARQCIPLLKDLHLTSRDLTAQIAKDEGLDFEYQQPGLLMLFQEHARAECEHLCETANSVGMHARLLSGPDEVRELDDNVHTIARGGLHIAEDAIIEPAKFVQQLADLLQQRGVRFLPDSEVHEVSRENGAVADVVTS